jgi:hypothetical protein
VDHGWIGIRFEISLICTLPWPFIFEFDEVPLHACPCMGPGCLYVFIIHIYIARVVSGQINGIAPLSFSMDVVKDD